MLVLGRKQGQAIRIGPAIEVRVVQTRSGAVSLGITAPREVPVVRTELLDAKGGSHVPHACECAAAGPTG